MHRRQLSRGSMRSSTDLLTSKIAKHYSLWHMSIDNSGVLTHQTNNSLMKIIQSTKAYRTTDLGNQLLVSVIFLMCHFISSLRTAMGVFPLLVCLSHENIPSTKHTYSCGGQEDNFCLICIIVMNRNNTRTFSLFRLT